jgi:hypothetical protein
MYGSVDRNAAGSFTIEGDTLKLKSDKEPGKLFNRLVLKTLFLRSLTVKPLSASITMLWMQQILSL